MLRIIKIYLIFLLFDVWMTSIFFFNWNHSFIFYSYKLISVFVSKSFLAFSNFFLIIYCLLYCFSWFIIFFLFFIFFNFFNFLRKSKSGWKSKNYFFCPSCHTNKNCRNVFDKNCTFWKCFCYLLLFGCFPLCCSYTTKTEKNR